MPDPRGAPQASALTPAPAISVILANYNHARYLAESLGALLSQSVRPVELIVIDDASTDHSMDIIEDFARRDPVVRPVRNGKNQGIARSFKTGVDQARGEFIYMAAADDRVLPGFFETSAAMLLRYPSAGLSCAMSRIIDESGNDRGPVQIPMASGAPCLLTPEQAGDLFRRYDTWIAANTVVYRRSAVIDAGGCIPELRTFYDGFMHRAIAFSRGACFIPEVLTCWRRHSENAGALDLADPNIALDILRHAGRLMRTTHRRVFPAAYVELWERRWVYSMLHGRLTLRRAHLAELMRSLPVCRLPERILLFCLFLFNESEFALVRVYRAIRLIMEGAWGELVRKIRRRRGPGDS